MIAETVSKKSKRIRKNSTSNQVHVRYGSPFNMKYRVATEAPKSYVIPSVWVVSHPVAKTLYAYEAFKSSIYGKLDELKNLQNNWDGENSPAPNNNTIELAKRTAQYLIERGLIISFCYPLRNGGIQLEESDGRNSEFEVYPDGSVHELVYDSEFNLVSNNILDL
jgi:hypothetical protein